MASFTNIISIFCLNLNVKDLICHDRLHGIYSIG
ncbi:Uncharacterised protein [Mycobacterium tuberculosis]|nr:Uncharacterised protein [Mycobacterium tuberculosis]